ncbi:hypothetical protein DFS34DRAFT_665968 [Phlyctochytrium arcticum]|nr:hypothetical protein DFS34DRAFT_665968 [Phlyctochytrium arcticum]
MFLERAQQLGLLKHDAESDILTAFPLGVKKKLIFEVTQYLLTPPNSHPPVTTSPDPAHLLTSPAHVRWMMEVVGQGFSLPIEDVGIIQMTVAVYANWLLEPACLPVAVKDLRGEPFEQTFWQTIFQQLSLLFQPRSRADTPSGPSASSVHPQHSSSHTSGSASLSPWAQPVRPPPNHHHQQATSAAAAAVANSTAIANTYATVDTENSDGITVHVDMCHAVLRIFTDAGRVLGANFSEETWIVVLKVLIAIADCLLREPVWKGYAAAPPDAGHGGRGATAGPATGVAYDYEDAGARMADELCEHLIRVLIELWLRSNLKQVFMWDHLKRYFTLWTHRTKVINQWSATILGLSQRVVGLLYGTEEGAANVQIQIHAYQVTLDLPSDFVYYAWHRMIYLLGNPNALHAKNFEVAIRGIARVVAVWHSIGQTAQLENADEASTVPDGNTLLHMFGGWLFEAVSKMGSEYAEGKAESLGILCRIFCQPQRRRKFIRAYLERFYHSLEQGLRGDNASLVSVILNSPELFIRDLPGIRLLVPDFVLGLRRVLPVTPPAIANARPDMPSDTDDLRRAAYLIVGNIIALPNHFEEVPAGLGWEAYDYYMRGHGDELVISRTVKAMYALAEEAILLRKEGTSDQEKSVAPRHPSFRSLKSHLVDLLLTSLLVEAAPSNAKYVLHLLCSFVAEDAPFCPGLPALVVRTIQDKLTWGWPPDVMKVAFHTLNTCAYFFSYIRRDNKHCARELVLSMCRFIDNCFQDENLVATQSLIMSAYDTITHWILLGQWIVEDRECHNAVIATLCRGIGVTDRDDDFAGVSASVSNSLSTSMTSGNLKDLSNGVTGTGDRERTPTNSTLQSFMSGSTVMAGPALADKKKLQRHSMAASKLIPKLRAAAVGTAQAIPVSTGTKDSGLGLPTFANLTAEMMIKSAAELALAQFLNRLGNFPPFGEVTGVTRVSSVWNEEAEIRRIIGIREKIKRQRQAGTSNPDGGKYGSGHDDFVKQGSVAVSDFRRYMRYYAFDRRLIIGIIETPHWARDDDDAKENRNSSRVPTPQMTMVVRESTGKYTWMTTLKYTHDHIHGEGPLSSAAARPNASHRTSMQPSPHPPAKPDDHSLPAPSHVTNSAHSLSSSDHMSTSSPPTSSTSAIDQSSELNHHSGNSWPSPSQKEARHFRPFPYPYTPQNASVVTFKSVNEDSIPSLDDIIPLGSDSSRNHGVVTAITSKWRKREIERIDEILRSDDYKKSTTAAQPPPIDLMDSDAAPRAFRLFLGHLGFLTPETQSKLWPLQMSDALLKDLHRVDVLPERDCMGFAVLFCRSGDESLDTILQHRTVSRDFDEFMHCIGWPIDVASHNGFRGNLDPSFCDTAPYYASRHLEAIFHSPYYIRDQVFAKSHPAAPVSSSLLTPAFPSVTPSAFLSAPSTLSRSEHIPNPPNGITRPLLENPRPRPISSYGMFPPALPFSESSALTQSPTSMSPNHSQHRTSARARFFSHIANEDLVHIIWIEDLHKFNSIPGKLGRYAAQLSIFVHPLPHTPGLYFIRILGNPQMMDDQMNIGPLVDGMIVSRHSLGLLVRTTAISAHKHCRTLKGTSRRPTMTRRSHIEDVCNKHKMSLSIGRFYADIFT